MDQQQENIVCPSCKAQVPSYSYFCLNCGKKLRAKPLSTGVGRQIIVYLVSFFIPPFGLMHAYKYFRQEGTAAKIIGAAAVVLTIIALYISYITIKRFTDFYTDLLNGNFEQYPNFAF